MAKKPGKYTMSEETRQAKVEHLGGMARAAAQKRWGNGGPVRADLVPVEGTGLLYAMRFVMVNGFHHDKGQVNEPMLKAARKMLRDDPLAFDRRMRELESGLKPEVPVVIDLGEDAALKILDRLLSLCPGNTDAGSRGMAQAGSAGVPGESGVPEMAH